MEAIRTPTPTSEPSAPPPEPAPVPAPPPASGRPRLLAWLGLAVSLLAVAAVVWWASRQKAPPLPHTAGELLELAGAIALYGLATIVRGERWRRLLEDEGGKPSRGDALGLTCVGYAVNNVLPARAGDAVRVVLMAPRAGTSMRTAVGTLVAERLLDVAVLVALFVVVGYGLLGTVGSGRAELVAAIVGGGLLLAVLAWRVVRRSERVHAFLAPMVSATLGLRRAHHGLRLLAMTIVIWAIETGVWSLTAGAIGFGVNPIEGAYLVALASVFSMIPSGPAYAGTQDAAAIIGVKALGGTGAQAVAYIVMLRFVIVVPITVVGLILAAVRYGGLRRLRALTAGARP
jgi:glycosyltransferase 2 family protein